MFLTAVAPCQRAIASCSAGVPPGSAGGARASYRVATPHGNAAEASAGSGAARRRCPLCGCWVEGGASGWETHAVGIQHRRQASSAGLLATVHLHLSLG